MPTITRSEALARANAARAAEALHRRAALLEDLDWMRSTGETALGAMDRLAAASYTHGRYRSPTRLADALRQMDFPPGREQQLAAVMAWLAPDAGWLARRALVDA